MRRYGPQPATLRRGFLVDWASMCSQGLLLGGNMNVPGGYETVVRAAELVQGGLREAVRSSKNARL